MANAIHPKTEFPTNTVRSGTGLGGWFSRVFTTQVGGKQLTAFTGLLLSLWVIGHLAGNLQIFKGQVGINDYALFLAELGPLLWLERILLLGVFSVHIYWGIRLKRRSRLARPQPYAFESTVQATVASRTMLATGLVVGVFILFHLAHYTFGVVKGADLQIPAEGPTDPATAELMARHDIQPGQTVRVGYNALRDSRDKHDVYSMVIYGFRNPIISGIYILAMLVFFFHLKHGFGSAFQSLGANSPRLERIWRASAWGVALFVVVGNISIPVAILAGALTPYPDIGLTLEAAYK